MANYEPKGVEWMREIAREGGIASAKRRLESIEPVERRLIAIKAARVRWKKAPWSQAEEAAYLEGQKDGYERGTGWKSRNPKRTVAADCTEQQLERKCCKRANTRLVALLVLLSQAAASPSNPATNATCPTMSPFDNHLI